MSERRRDTAGEDLRAGAVIAMQRIIDEAPPATRHAWARPAPIGGRAADLVLVTDRARLCGRSLAEIVDAAVDGGVNIVQLRDRAATPESMLRDAMTLRDVTRGRALLFVNADVEAAIAAGADGVHLPEDHGSIDDLRARVGAAMLISRAVHSSGAAVEAQRQRVDVVQAGTVFATASKPGARTLGIDGLRAICNGVRRPVIAIGGITPEHAASAIRAGAVGVAVIGAIFDAADPRAAAAGLRSVLDLAAARLAEGA